MTNAGVSSKYDVVIAGGGPGGLAAALALGRARKRVLLCDAAPRRNAAAERIHNFVTRDGTPPEEFRRIGREQLATYPNVEIRVARVEAVTGARGAFRVGLTGEEVDARRVLLCTGMIDTMLAVPGFQERWGHGIVQCPYCHGWEARERRWGFLPTEKDSPRVVPFAVQLRAWTPDVAIFTNGAFEVPAEAREPLRAAGVKVETGKIARLVGEAPQIEGVELASGAVVPCDLLFSHPPQRQVELVTALGLALDDDGFVKVDPMTRESSVPGVYAGGDLTTRMQGAMFAAASALQAAVMLNLELTIELETS